MTYQVEPATYGRLSPGSHTEVGEEPGRDARPEYHLETDRYGTRAHSRDAPVALVPCAPKYMGNFDRQLERGPVVRVQNPQR